MVKINLSVFNTTPPNFFNNETAAIVQNHYDLINNISSLSSDRDQNFLCSNNQKKYVLKISNSDERKDVLKMQKEALYNWSNELVEYAKS